MDSFTLKFIGTPLDLGYSSMTASPVAENRAVLLVINGEDRTRNPARLI